MKKTKEEEENNNNKKKKGWNLFWFIVKTIVIFALFLLVAKIIMNFTNPNDWPNKINLLKATFYAEILYSMLSFRRVKPKELAAVLFFDKPIAEVGPGLHFVPFLVCSLAIETRLTQQLQFPADPEDVDKSGNDIIEHGKVAPIRVTHSGSTDANIDPLERRMTTEVSALCRYRISDYLTFLKTIGSIEEMRRQIRDTVEVEIKIQFAKRTVKQTLLDWEEITETLREKVKSLTLDWGVEIKDVQIVDIDLGKKVNEALRDLPAAELRVKTRTADAIADSNYTEKTGKAAADVKEFNLLAEAKGKKAMEYAEAAGIARKAKIAISPEGKLTLYLETMDAAFANAKHTIITNGDMFSSVASISAILKNIKEEGGK